MDRALFEEEIIIFQASSLTVTNLRIWDGMRSSHAMNLRSMPLKDVSEVSLKYRRPLRTLLSSIVWFSILAAIAVLAPNKIMFVSLSAFKICFLAGAGLILIIGILIFMAGSTLVLVLREKVVQFLIFQSRSRVLAPTWKKQRQ